MKKPPQNRQNAARAALYDPYMPLYGKERSPVMKRSSLIYGFNPYALRSAGRNDPLVAVSLQELARIGIPGAQGPARDAGTAGAGGGRPELRGRETLLKLARHIAAQLW